MHRLRAETAGAMSRQYPYRCRLASSSYARGPPAPPGRSANHAAEIAAPESRVLVREHVGLDVAECRVGLVFDAVIERLDDVFLEMLGARMRVHDGFAFIVAVCGIAQPQHVHLDARGPQR